MKINRRTLIGKLLVLPAVPLALVGLMGRGARAEAREWVSGGRVAGGTPPPLPAVGDFTVTMMPLYDDPRRPSGGVCHLTWKPPAGAHSIELVIEETRVDGSGITHTHGLPGTTANYMLYMWAGARSYVARVRAGGLWTPDGAAYGPVSQLGWIPALKPGPELTIHQHVERGWVECWKCGERRMLGVPGVALSESQVWPCPNECDQFWNLCVQPL